MSSSCGVCGPTVDPQLPRFAADREWLASKGVSVERFNLAQQPEVFAANAQVKQVLEAEGTDCLPLVLGNDVMVSKGSYPESGQPFRRLYHGERMSWSGRRTFEIWRARNNSLRPPFFQQENYENQRH